MKNNFMADNCGAGNAVVIAILAVGAIALYITLKVLPPYMDNGKLERAVTDEYTYQDARDANGFYKKVMKAANDLGIEPDPDNVEVVLTDDGKGIDIYIYYEREVKFPGYTYVADFEIEEELRGSWLAKMLDSVETRVQDAYDESYDRLEGMTEGDEVQEQPSSGGGRHKGPVGYADKAREATGQ